MYSICKGIMTISLLVSFTVLGSSYGSKCYGKNPPKSTDEQTAEYIEKLPDSVPAQPEKRTLPVYISELSNLNDYNIFANGGWDGNWFIGLNVCWIEELPVPPAGKYERAFIGAKIGRAKTRPVSKKPVWEKEPIPGEIYLSIASTPAWKSNQKYFLTDTANIPLEADMENALEGTGEARWFWVEVPLNNVNLDGPNYIALWTPTDFFVSVTSSPILAGGWGGQKVNSWLNNDVRGYAPISAANSLKTAISVFEPAIAMKLIPEGSFQEISVSIESVKEGREKTSNQSFNVLVRGDAIEKIWLEISQNGQNWNKIGINIYGAPYILTLKSADLPEGNVQVRCAAEDIWGNIGYSKKVEVTKKR